VVDGLMAGPTIVGSGRAPFRQIRALADHLGLVERCMGMTDDLEDAIAEGATMVRVGRGLFSRDR
jgi:PLP dependent protein